MSTDTGPRTSTPRSRGPFGRRPTPPADPAPVGSGAVTGPGRPTPRQSSSSPPPPLPGRRNPKWIALGVVAICLGGLLSFVIYSRVATETSVVAVAHTVYRGETIETDDLTTVTLRRGSVAKAIPATELKNLIGQRAVFDLAEGSVVSSASVGDLLIPAEDQAAIGLKLSGGRAPTNLLLPGSPIRLIALPPVEASQKDKLSGSVYVARVVDQTAAPDGTSTLVNVEVAANQAPTIATLAAQDRIAVVRDAGR